jgi:hypothetical protein
MKPILLLLYSSLLLALNTVCAQTESRTIPGVFTGDHWDNDWKVMQVSPDGKEVLFQQAKYHLLLVREGKLLSIDTYVPLDFGSIRVSPDHTISYSTATGVSDGSPGRVGYNFSPIPKIDSYISVLMPLIANKPSKIFVDTNYILGINNQGQLLTTSPWLIAGRVGGYKCLRLLDPKTYKLLKVLRTDTLGWASSAVFFNSNYTALLTSNVYSAERRTVQIFPFGSDSVIKGTLPLEDAWHYTTADEHYIYAADKDTFGVYSMHTGQLLYNTITATALPKPEWSYRRCLYAYAGNGHIFRFDREQAIVQELEASPSGLNTIKTYPLDKSNLQPLPPANQRYQMAICAGPSLVIIPRIRIDVSGPENVGYIIDLPSGKVTLQIAPFYNVGAEQLAREAKYQEGERLYWEKHEADKKANAKAEAAAAQKEREADCQRIINEEKWKQGTHIPLGALVYKSTQPGTSCRVGYAIWGFDCDTKHFTARGLYHYDADAHRIDYSLCETGPFVICPKCDGHPTSTSTQWIKDDAVHQTNFNTYKRDPNAVKQVQATTTCDRCRGKGYVKQ